MYYAVPAFSKARLAANKMFDVIDATKFSKPEVRAASKSIESVEAKSVSFKYDSSSSNVLQDVDLSIFKGKVVALVGESGCGKSTILSLIMRLYDVTSGEILLNGRNIEQYLAKDVRNKMALVSQEPVMFSGSIAENVSYGKVGGSTVSHDDIVRVCKQANIHDAIMSLPDQYETQMGDRGVQVSGGQKQRIAIARALLRDPDMLLLDEATSALDTKSERIVQAALNDAMKSRTVLVVAHRLSTIQHADVIVALRDGKVVEFGTHQELLQAKGLYYTMVNRQRI